MNFTSESVMHDIEVALKERSNEDWSDTDRLLLKAQLHIASLQRQLDHAKILLRKLQERQQWQYLTDEDIKEIVGQYGGAIGGYTRKLFDKIEAKIREKNDISSS